MFKNSGLVPGTDPSASGVGLDITIWVLKSEIIRHFALRVNLSIKVGSIKH